MAWDGTHYHQPQVSTEWEGGVKMRLPKSASSAHSGVSSGEAVEVSVSGVPCWCALSVSCLLSWSIVADGKTAAVHPFPGEPGPVLCRGLGEGLADPAADLAPLDACAGPAATVERCPAACQDP